MTHEPLVERGREHRDALVELKRLNAELLSLWLVEQRVKRMQAAGKRKTTSRKKPR